MVGALTLASIVEGQGEVAALPPLLRRIARDKFGVELKCLTPHRLSRSKFGDTEAFRNAVLLQANRSAPDGAVLILLDADDDEPHELRQQLHSVAKVTPGLGDAVEVAVAVREFEAWFLASIESLRAHRSVLDEAVYASDPERRRNCKKLLEGQMVESYKEIRHQVAFASLLDIDAAMENSPSFGLLVNAIGALILTAEERALKALAASLEELE